MLLLLSLVIHEFICRFLDVGEVIVPTMFCGDTLGKDIWHVIETVWHGIKTTDFWIFGSFGASGDVLPVIWIGFSVLVPTWTILLRLHELVHISTRKRKCIYWFFLCLFQILLWLRWRYLFSPRDFFTTLSVLIIVNFMFF